MHISVFIPLFTLATLLPFPLSATQTTKPAAAPVQPAQIQLLTRSARRTESRHLSFGSTVTLIGAPRGAVTVEGWSRNTVELTAEIELKAETEGDLDQLRSEGTRLNSSH